MEINDIVGQKFFGWTIIEKATKRSSEGSIQYLCRCSCGIEKLKTKRAVSCGTSKQCKLCANKIVSLTRLEENKKRIIGTNIGLWKVIGHVNENNISKYICECPCGKIRKKSLCMFRKHKGCIKCAPKKNIKPTLTAYHLEKAKEKLGKAIGSFRILEISHVAKGQVNYKCKCLFCKKEVTIPAGAIPFRESCGCIRQKNRPRGSLQHFSKLDETDVGAIRSLYESGYYSMTELAKQFSISLTNVSEIINRKSWKHVK